MSLKQKSQKCIQELMTIINIIKYFFGKSFI